MIDSQNNSIAKRHSPQRLLLFLGRLWIVWLTIGFIVLVVTLSSLPQSAQDRLANTTARFQPPRAKNAHPEFLFPATNAMENEKSRCSTKTAYLNPSTWWLWILASCVFAALGLIATSKAILSLQSCAPIAGDLLSTKDVRRAYLISILGACCPIAWSIAVDTLPLFSHEHGVAVFTVGSFLVTFTYMHVIIVRGEVLRKMSDRVENIAAEVSTMRDRLGLP